MIIIPRLVCEKLLSQILCLTSHKIIWLGHFSDCSLSMCVCVRAYILFMHAHTLACLLLVCVWMAAAGDQSSVTPGSGREAVSRDG